MPGVARIDDLERIEDVTNAGQRATPPNWG